MPVKVTKKDVTVRGSAVSIKNNSLANALVQDHTAAVKLLGVSASAIKVTTDGRIVITDLAFATRIKADLNLKINIICGKEC